ncbi:MAG: tripartite tricarboxylate transporter substrate binding protein [Rubrivivax sp.]
MREIEPRTWRCLRWLTSITALIATSVVAQTFPTKPISLVVSFSPGGVTDIVARMLAEPLGKELGQPVIVENVPGAGGNVAFVKIANAAPDGYSLLLASTSTVTNPALQKDSRFDPVKSYAPIGFVGAIPFWMLVNPAKSDLTTVAKLVEKAHHGGSKLTYGSGGVGTASHLGPEYFKFTEQASILHIPYKGQSAAVTDLLAGTVDMVYMPVSGTEDLVRSGKLKALATTSQSRLAGFADVPSFAEAGFPKMDVGGWLGLVAPAGTPAPIADRIGKALNKILAQPEFRAKLAERGMEARITEPVEFGHYIEREVMRWRDLVAKTGIRAE